MYEVLAVIASNYAVTIEDIRGSSRSNNLPEARKVACYLLIGKHTAPEIAKLLNKERTYVYRMTIDARFYIKNYPEFKNKIMKIEKEAFLLRKEILEEFLKEYPNADSAIIYEKQRELESINNQINKQ